MGLSASSSCFLSISLPGSLFPYSMSNVSVKKQYPVSCENFPRERSVQLNIPFRYQPHEGCLSLSHDSELHWPWVPHQNLQCCLFMPKFVCLGPSSFPCLCGRIWFSCCEWRYLMLLTSPLAFPMTIRAGGILSQAICFYCFQSPEDIPRHLEGRQEGARSKKHWVWQI